MSGQGRSTASSRPYPWSPRLTVSGGGQSQYSAYTIYSDVESDHNVFAFVPPPAGGAEFPVQPPIPGPLPVLEEIPRPTTAFHLPTTSESHQRQVIPPFGRFVRRFTASDVSGTRPATQNTSEERLQSSLSSLDSARGNTTNSGDSDVFNYALPRQDDTIEPPRLVLLDEASRSFGGDPSVPSQLGEKERDLRCDSLAALARDLTNITSGSKRTHNWTTPTKIALSLKSVHRCQTLTIPRFRRTLFVFGSLGSSSSSLRRMWRCFVTCTTLTNPPTGRRIATSCSDIRLPRSLLRFSFSWPTPWASYAPWSSHIQHISFHGGWVA